MSFRGDDQNLIHQFRALKLEVEKLKKNQGAQRQNTVRLGNWVIEAEADRKLMMRNVDTGETSYVGAFPFVGSKEWSYAGTVNPADDVYAPPLSCPHDIQVTHAIFQFQTSSSNTYSLSTFVNDTLQNTVLIPSGVRKYAVEMNLAITEGANFYPVLAANGSGTGTEFSVTYWYVGIYED